MTGVSVRKTRHSKKTADKFSLRHLLIALGSLCLLTGCGTMGNPYFMGTASDAVVFVKKTQGIESIAVMPFQAPTELIGSSIADSFVTELMYFDDRIEMVERSQMDQFLGESELSLAGLSTSQAIKVGKMAGADAVVVGTVSEYEMRAIKSKTYAEVGVSARLIDCETGRVLWSATLSRRADSYKDTLAWHAQKVIHELMSGVYREWLKKREKQ